MSGYVIDETPQSRRELRASQYAGHANAEDLIRAHFASVSPEVRSGVRLNENADALAAAKEANAGEQIKVPDGTRLIDWTVRGTDPRRMVISFVFEDETGRWHHGVQGYNEDYSAPEETPAMKAQREVAMADHKTRLAGAAFNVELEERMEAFRVEQQAELAERFSALKDDLVSAVQQIVADSNGEGGSKPGEGSNTTSSRRTDSSGQSGKGDPEAAPEPGGSGDSGSSGGSADYPRQHAGLDELQTGSGQDKPDGWDDMKVDEKIAALQAAGVQPEASGE